MRMCTTACRTQYVAQNSFDYVLSYMLIASIAQMLLFIKGAGLNVMNSHGVIVVKSARMGSDFRIIMHTTYSL